VTKRDLTQQLFHHLEQQHRLLNGGMFRALKGIVSCDIDGLFMILSYSLDDGPLPLGILLILILCFHIFILILMLAQFG
jgi:hypothetical protein